MFTDPGVLLACTCGACPEQYEGTVDGNPAYFRLRHSYWRFCIVEPDGDPVGPDSTPDKKVLYYKEGEYERGQDAGIMEDAQGLIMRMVQEFRAGFSPECEQHQWINITASSDGLAPYLMCPRCGSRKQEEPNG